MTVLGGQRAGVLLASQTLGDLRPLGAFGQPVYRAYGQIRAAVEARLGERFANFFARPHLHAAVDRIDWFAPVDGAAVPYGTLPPEQQALLRADLQAMLAQFHALAAEFAADRQARSSAVFAKLLELALIIPDQEKLFLVGDQPVIAFWGFERSHVGAAYDPLSELARVPAVPPGAGPTPAAARRLGLWGILWRALLILLVLLALLLGLHHWRALPSALDPLVPAAAPKPGEPPAERPGGVLGVIRQLLGEDTTTVVPGSGDVTVVPGQGEVGVVPGKGEAVPGKTDLAEPGATDALGNKLVPPGGIDAKPPAGTEKPPLTEKPPGADKAPGMDKQLQPNKPNDANKPTDANMPTDANKPNDANKPTDANKPNDANAPQPNKPPDANQQTEANKPPSDQANAKAPPLPPKPQDLAGSGAKPGAAKPPGSPGSQPLSIPQGAAARGDVTFLQGDWSSEGNLVDQRTGAPLQQQYRFDDKGEGQVVVRQADGSECRGTANARMTAGGALQIQEKSALRCTDGSSFTPSTTECKVGANGEADCQGRNPDGSTYTVRVGR